MAPNKSLVLLAAILLVATTAGQVDAGSLLPALSPTGLISGIVPCSIGSNISLASVLPFPNATVQVVCGNTTVANVTTGSNGAFAISLGSLLTLPIPTVFALLNGQCRVVVATPLVACNASLAGVNGTLSAALQLLGGTTTTTGGIVMTILGIPVQIINGVVTLVTGLFSIVQIINGAT